MRASYHVQIQIAQNVLDEVCPIITLNVDDTFLRYC